MEEMILSEPGLVGPILASGPVAEAAALIRTADEPLLLTGCGTSEHAAMAGAALLGGGARDAFEASLEPQQGGVLIAVSHEGETAATLAALAAADAAKVLVTALPDVATGRRSRHPHAAARHVVVPHGRLSQPLLVFTAMAGHLDPAPIESLIAELIARRPSFTAHAQTLRPAERLLVVAGGVDEVTAHELALKIEEGTHVPTTPLGLEKVLHGHLPAADSRTGLVILRLDRREGDRRDRRAQDVAAAAKALNMPTVILDELPPSSLPPVPAALLAGALAAQLLTLELVLAHGTNPDLIRREDPAYKAAADAAST